ncbi:PilW family protein [Nitrosococcus oceani]|uniref:PilW family protein n=1 Tax=Nitrosococcus oceani TaxID=1229 RepID=UPI0004E95060|nr:PilW family protein [Nitrosococcus oceani]KFI22032.1 pilus assembly protein PilW [Nitrosococcus oceani]
MKRPSYLPSSRAQRGFSLVEILAGMTAGLILTTGVIQIFSSSKQSYRLQEALSRLQENGRFAVELISYEARNAGYFGCAGTETRVVNTLNNAEQFAWDFSTPLQGFEATSASRWTPALDATITQPLGNRDVLTFRHTSGNLAKVEPPFMPTTSAALHITPDNGLKKSDIVMVSDCVDAAILQVTNANPDTSGTLVHNTGNGVTPGNATKDLGKRYTGKANIIQITTSTYYIRANPWGVPSLYRKENDDNPQELIEGVEDMQILYGEDTDGSQEANGYVTADNVANWNNVVSLRLNFLLQTMENYLASSPQSYTFNGATITPSDRRLRRVFTTTLNLRNRTL